jgi:hypothetical protein
MVATDNFAIRSLQQIEHSSQSLSSYLGYALGFHGNLAARNKVLEIFNRIMGVVEFKIQNLVSPLRVLIRAS